jgi:hypothetical protein
MTVIQMSNGDHASGLSGNISGAASAEVAPVRAFEGKQDVRISCVRLTVPMPFVPHLHFSA